MMRLALAEAERAAANGDVPIGAVVGREDEVLAAAGNERELRLDPTAHAEILALRAAAEPRLNHRPEVVAGLLAEEAGELLRGFFATRRGPRE